MGGMLNLTKGSMLKAGGLGIGGAIVGAGTNYLVDKQRKKGNEKSANAINIGGSMASGALTGAAIGSLVPVIGTTIGAIAGGVIGGAMGLYENSQQNNGSITPPIHDGFSTIGKNLGSDFSKNRAIVQGGKITPIDNKDDLLAMKPGGAVDRTINKQQVNTIKHEFGEITFNGNITLTTPGNQKLSVDLTRDPVFVREITKIIQSETEKTFNQGKNK